MNLQSSTIDLKQIQIKPETLSKVSARFASYYKIIPFDFKDNILYVAAAQPVDASTREEISLVTNSDVECAISDEKGILEAIESYYGIGAETIEQMMGESGELTAPIITEDQDPTDEVSISKFLNQILSEAVKKQATDIHIEPYNDHLKVRYRIDGILFDAKIPPNIIHFKDSIVARIKILSHLNIAEKRLPQDGRFKIKLNNKDLDLRVSFLPSPHGESLVLRVLNVNSLHSLDNLGLSSGEQDVINQLIQKPHGIIFITGPTGSGKTTTLYSCLELMNGSERKIITIEDPLEYELKGIIQIQTNPAIGLTFAQGLRSMLRHDPDVMMVGEVRDRETADIAIQIALTGHLIFSTLHTNDAASGITRLIDMGIEPFLIASTVHCFVAQRLIRKICSHCKEPALYPKTELKTFMSPDKITEPANLYKGKGCPHCHQSGYSGREGIYEFLIVDEDMRKLILEKAPAARIRKHAIQKGMKTLIQSGWEKVLNGTTTPQEIMRVVQKER